jgi:hypothetical protein
VSESLTSSPRTADTGRKDRLAFLRTRTPSTTLSDAQLAVAREYGFPSWRALKSEIDRRDAPYVADFSRACKAGDVAAMRGLLSQAPSLVRERLAAGPRDVSLWFYTKDVRTLYELLKRRQVRFDEDLYTPFYGGWQFSVQDLNGLSLIFWQPEWIG